MWDMSAYIIMWANYDKYLYFIHLYKYVHLYTHSYFPGDIWIIQTHIHITHFWQINGLLNKPWLYFSGFICNDYTFRKQKPSVYIEAQWFSLPSWHESNACNPLLLFSEPLDAVEALWYLSCHLGFFCLHPTIWVFSCRSPAQRRANEYLIKIQSSSPHWEFPLQFQLDNDALCFLHHIKVWCISSICNKNASR